MADTPKQSLFQKINALSHAAVDGYLDQMKKSDPGLAQRPYGMNRVIPMRTSWNEDLERLQGEWGYKQKLTLLTDQHKLLMYLKAPIVGSIIQRRTTQACNFAVPQKDPKKPGFVWKKKKEDDKEFTDEEKKTVEMLNAFVLNCGIKDDERTNADEDMPFVSWIKRSIKDTLIYDLLAIEIVPDHAGCVHHWLPVSGATVRIAAPSLSKHNINDDLFAHIDKQKPLDSEKLAKGMYKYVQVVNGQIRKGFTKEEMIVAFRNEVNDFFTNGYPISELDLLMNVVNAHLNADNYNRSIFTNGITSNGIINLKGDVDDDQLKAFRRSYYAQGIGMDAMLRTPVINTPEGIEYVKLDNSHKDLEYSDYINYLIKLTCSIYQINPEEIGFTTGGKSDADGNSQNYSNVEKKILISQEAGLKPLLTFIESIINEQILPAFSKELYAKYKFEFVGLNIEDVLAELERLEKEGKIFKTINEIRAEKKMDSIKGGDVIDNQSFMTAWALVDPEAVKAAQAQAGGEGGPGGGDDAAAEAPVQYVDEDGNPIDPEDVDPNTMEFTDEDGNPVNHDGSPMEGAPDKNKLPFEDELPEEDEDDKDLPFEDGAKSTHSKGKNSDKKLPWED